MEFKRGDKKRYKEEAQRILHGAEFGVSLGNADFEFMVKLLGNHPEAPAKMGIGVRHIEARPHPMSARCFWIVRKDGSETDFSFHSCLRASKPHQDVLAACRRAISDQILAFKDRAFAQTDELVCPISGEIVTRANGHVDHASPWTFEKIVRDFVDSSDLSLVLSQHWMGLPKHASNQRQRSETFRCFIDQKQRCG